MDPPRRCLSGRHVLTTALVVFLGVAATPLGVHGSATTPRRPFPDALRLPAAAAARASPPITPSASGFSEVPLTGGLLHKGDYAVAATLGGQPLRLKADTTSGSVVVARAACEYCPAAGAKYDDAASPAAAGAPSPANATVVACADPVCGVSTPGGEPDAGQCAALECKACSAGGACCAPGKPGGCWFARAGHHRAGSGRLGRDVLALAAAADGAAAGGVSANVTFGGMDLVEGPFFPDGADGLLGLGLDASACEPSCTRPFAAEVGAGDGGVGLCVNVVGGALTFGGVNESHLAAGASLSWFGVTPIAGDDVGQPAVARKWLTSVSPSMRVGNATVDAPKVKTALWTSSTPFVGVSPELFLSILSELQKAYCELDEVLCSQRTWFRPQSCVHLPDGVLAGLPNFTFTVGGPDDAAPLDVVLTPEDYLLPYPQGSKLYHCVSLVALDMDARDEQLIFGASVLRRYVSYWDRAGRRLGLGPASGACGSSVPVEKGLLSTDGGDDGGDAAGGSAAPGHKLPPAITAESVLGAVANSSGGAAPGAATPTATGGREDRKSVV